MTIEIHQPDLEALIRQRMESGEFRSVSDLIRSALISLAPFPTMEVRDHMTAEQRAEAFRNWAESHHDEVVLPESAMTRADYYGERG